MNVLSRLHQSESFERITIAGPIVLSSLASLGAVTGWSYGTLLLAASVTAGIINYTDIIRKMRETLAHLHYQYFVPEQEKISEPFFTKIAYGQLSKQKIQALINRGVNFNARDSFLGLFNTALIWGVANANVRTVVNLLKCNNIENADLDLTDLSERRNTALTLAIIKGWDHVDTDSIDKPLRMLHLIKALVNAGANIHKTNALGDTPLHIAILRRDIGAIKYLLSKGASLTTLNKEGKTPIDMLQKSYPAMKKYVSQAAVFTIMTQSRWKKLRNEINNLLNTSLKSQMNNPIHPINPLTCDNQQVPLKTAFDTGRDCVAWAPYFKSFFSANNYRNYSAWREGFNLENDLQQHCKDCKTTLSRSTKTM